MHSVPLFSLLISLVLAARPGVALPPLRPLAQIFDLLFPIEPRKTPVVVRRSFHNLSPLEAKRAFLDALDSGDRSTESWLKAILMQRDSMRLRHADKNGSWAKAIVMATAGGRPAMLVLLDRDEVFFAKLEYKKDLDSLSALARSCRADLFGLPLAVEWRYRRARGVALLRTAHWRRRVPGSLGAFLASEGFDEFSKMRNRPLAFRP